MYSFDTETSQSGGIVFLDLCIFYNGKEYIVFDRKDYSGQVDMKAEIINFIYNSGDNLFIAHNLEYDLNAIFYPFNLHKLEMFYNTNLIYARLNHTKIKFLDSFNFSFSSLKAVGQSIGLEKMETESFYNVEYCKMDCRIVYEYMLEFMNAVDDEFSLKIKNTLAGTAQNIYLKRFNDFNVGGMNVDDDLLNFYFGGRAECFKTGFIRQPVYALDINSSYPTSMYRNPFPVSEFTVSKKPESSQWFAECEIEINDCYIPVIPYRTEKLLFPAGRFKANINSMEYRTALNQGQIKDIKFLKVYNFSESAYIFMDFVKYFYGKRQTAKEKNDSFKSQFYKLILNSTYGRFALSGNLKVLKEFDSSFGYYETFMDKELMYKDFIINGNRTKNYSLPAFITASSRVLLFDLINKVMSIGGSPLYCDTDSVFFTLSENVEKDINLILKNVSVNNELGNYSLEVYKAMDIYNVKAYILYNFDDSVKAKCKGIPKDKRIEFLQTGKTNYSRPVKLRSALRSIEDLPANYWKEIFIERHGEYTKRKKIPRGVRGNKYPVFDTCAVMLSGC